MNSASFKLATDKYCRMTTIEMLERSQSCYEVTLERLQKQLEDITNKYYNDVDVPVEIAAKISNINSDIVEVEEIIKNIGIAISTIETEAKPEL